MKKPFDNKSKSKDDDKGYSLEDDGKTQGADKQEVPAKGPPQGNQEGDEDDSDTSGQQPPKEGEESSIKKKTPAKNPGKPTSDDSDNNKDSKGSTKIDLDPKLEVDDEDQNETRTESRADKVIRIAREYRDKCVFESVEPLGELHGKGKALEKIYNYHSDKWSKSKPGSSDNKYHSNKMDRAGALIDVRANRQNRQVDGPSKRDSQRNLSMANLKRNLSDN